MKLSISMTKTEFYLGWVLLIFQLLVLPVAAAYGNALLPVPLTLAELNFLLYAVNFALTLGLFHCFLWGSLRQSLRTPFRTLRSAFLGFLIYYLASLLVSLFVQTVCPEFSNINDQTIASMTQDNYTLMAVGTVLLVPLSEETLYRGLIFRGLQGKNRLLAYTVSILAFATIHVVGYIGTEKPVVLLLCFLQYLPAGFALAWAYERADSICAPILMHIAINQIGMSAMR